MKKDIRYSVSYNGLIFSFDLAVRDGYRLWFERKCLYSSNTEPVCFIDLNECVLRFSFKNEKIGVCYFDIVPVVGASDGK